MQRNALHPTTPARWLGGRDISSDDAVTGPQQSWQPGTQAKAGI